MILGCVLISDVYMFYAMILSSSSIFLFAVQWVYRHPSSHPAIDSISVFGMVTIMPGADENPSDSEVLKDPKAGNGWKT